MQFTFDDLNHSDELSSELILVPVHEKEKIPDKRALVQKTLKREQFTGKEGEVCSISFEDNTLIFIGAGKGESEAELQILGGEIASVIKKSKKEHVSVYIKNSKQAAPIAFGIGLGLYRFDVYKTDKKEKDLHIHILTQTPKETETAFAPYAALTDGIYEARDLVSEPSNMMTPKEFVEVARQIQGIKTDVLDEKEMEKLGMNLLLGVAKGSQNRPFLLTASYFKGGKKPVIALVGKGVCFDSGGISLKSSKGMGDMKYDMAGAAAVLGTLSALAKSKIKANVIGIMPLVENMPSSHAQKPGDIVQSLSGKTVEIANTDAEGRLILADAVTYAQEKFKPALLIDLATLTGAMITALGTQMAGLFSNDDELAEQIEKAALKTAGDSVWRMPLHKAYDKLLESDIADMSNMGSKPEAGSAVGAHFIGRFIRPETKWAHLDIAGVAWTNQDKPCIPKGATGFGVHLLTQFIEDYTR